MMKRVWLWAIVFCAAHGALAAPVNSNYVYAVYTSAVPGYTNFSWVWRRYADQKITLVSTLPGISSVWFRMVSPAGGTVWLTVYDGITYAYPTGTVWVTEVPKEAVPRPRTYWAEFVGCDGTNLTNSTCNTLASGMIRVEWSSFDPPPPTNAINVYINPFTLTNIVEYDPIWASVSNLYLRTNDAWDTYYPRSNPSNYIDAAIATSIVNSLAFPLASGVNISNRVVALESISHSGWVTGEHKRAWGFSSVYRENDYSGYSPSTNDMATIGMRVQNLGYGNYARYGFVDLWNVTTGYSNLYVRVEPFVGGHAMGTTNGLRLVGNVAGDILTSREAGWFVSQTNYAVFTQSIVAAVSAAESIATQAVGIARVATGEVALLRSESLTGWRAGRWFLVPDTTSVALASQSVPGTQQVLRIWGVTEFMQGNAGPTGMYWKIEPGLGLGYYGGGIASTNFVLVFDKSFGIRTNLNAFGHTISNLVVPGYATTGALVAASNALSGRIAVLETGALTKVEAAVTYATTGSLAAAVNSLNSDLAAASNALRNSIGLTVTNYTLADAALSNSIASVWTYASNTHAKTWSAYPATQVVDFANNPMKNVQAIYFGDWAVDSTNAPNLYMSMWGTNYYLYVRRGVWDPPRFVWHQGNFNPLAYQTIAAYNTALTSTLWRWSGFVYPTSPTNPPGARGRMFESNGWLYVWSDASNAWGRVQLDFNW